jgi:hypothetical protein
VFEKSNLRLGFRWFAIASFDLQLADAAIGDGNFIAHLAEVFRLDEFSFGSGVTVEVTHFHDLLHARERISVGHSYGAHETRPIVIQEIDSDGAVAVVRPLVGFRANDKGDAVATNLHL